MTFKSNTALSAPLDTTPLEVWIQYVLNPTPEKEIFNIYRVRYFYSTTVYPDGRTCTWLSTGKWRTMVLEMGAWSVGF
jgi:hypothetical protein